MTGIIITVILGLLGILAITIVIMIFFFTFGDLGVFIHRLFFPGFIILLLIIGFIEIL